MWQFENAIIFRFNFQIFKFFKFSNFQMKVAIYSRGLDFEQENPLLVLMEELARYDTTILIFHQLLRAVHAARNTCMKR
jgi:hypothetical protein